MSGIRVNVTEELVARATVKDSRHCMIAEAIQQARPKWTNILVDLATIRWTNPRTRTRYVALTPEEGRVALVKFDQGEPIEPFSLFIDAIQRTKMKQSRNGGTRPATRARTLKVKADGSAIQEGGATIPPGHLRGGGNRYRNEVASGPELPENASNVVVSSRRYRKYGLRLLKE